MKLAAFVAHRIDETEARLVGNSEPAIPRPGLDDGAFQWIERRPVAHHSGDGLPSPGEHDRKRLFRIDVTGLERDVPRCVGLDAERSDTRKSDLEASVRVRGAGLRFLAVGPGDESNDGALDRAIPLVEDGA
jgi:hypothetical protein